MKISFKNSVLKQLKYYRKKDPLAYKIIWDKLEDIMENPYDIRYIKVNKHPNYKRAKKGGYRICFKIVDDIIYVGRIDGREKVYN